MQHRVSRAVAAVALAATFATSACAYTFHPERRGNHGGDIAGAPLVGDLLWLIPGIIPGVVFLIVDFTSGAIYRAPYGYHEHISARPATPPPGATAQSTPAPNH
ncbi:MAG TPA: hypothetical protein VGG74_09625 [Kofleriaceae bacterium]|jgi:hypothetical protein